MRKMILCPNIDSFTAAQNSRVVATDVDAGYKRVRAGFTKTPTIVSVSWILTTFSEVEYMQAFFSSGIAGGVDKFLIDLQGLDQQDPTTGLHEYTVLIMPDSFTTDSNEGQFLFTYSCELEVQSERLSESSDITKLDQCEIDGDVSAFDPT